MHQFILCRDGLMICCVTVFRSSPLVEEFTSRFPRMSLHAVLSEYSLPAPLGEHRNPFGLPQQQVCGLMTDVESCIT